MIGFHPRLIPWLGELVRWASTPGSIVVPLAVPFLLVSFWPSEPVIRWSGVAFELLGLLSVAAGVAGTRKHFGLPSFWQQVISSFPPLRRDTTVILGSAKITAAGAIGAARGRTRYGPGARVEQRLEALEAEVDRLTSELFATTGRLEQRDRELGERLEQERQARELGDDTIRRSMKDHETGGLRLSTLGLLWVALGIVMGTGSSELAAWGQWLDAPPPLPAPPDPVWVYLSGQAFPR